MPHSGIKRRTRRQARQLRKAPTELVIELDGSQHADARANYDLKRTAWLESQGYRVLRFWNNDVLKSPHGVGEAIFAATRQSPTPSPSPQGGGVQVRASGKDLP